MTVAYFDTFSGASGDMIVGALLDTGLSMDDLRADLAKLALEGYSISANAVQKRSLAATKFDVTLDDHHDHDHQHERRGLADIVGMIGDSSLAQGVKDRAVRVFERLAAAEAAVHGVRVEDVHFHEIGAVDSIVDIVGAAIGLERLGITKIIAGPLRFGSGTIECAHGTLPVPAPATARLAEGFPVEYTGVAGELTTPTGAAILTALADSFGPPPPMKLTTIGIGAGSAERDERPNILRILIGDESDTDADVVVILEANIDDASGEIIAYATERLLAAGALDAFSVPIQMKKSRPGVLLSVIAKPEDWARMEEIIFRETTTLGIRRREEARTKLERQFVEVEVFGEPVTVKLGILGGEVVTIAPEYESCARVAQEKNIPLREIYEAAREVARPR